MMIDTHCHLDINDYEDVEEVIKHMNGNIIIASGCNSEGNRRVVELVSKYDNIYGTIGIHPEEITDNINEDLLFIESNLNNPKIVGVGEIGLDYHYSKEYIDLQKEYFIKQINLAKKYNKTIVIHSRDAIEDTYDILEQYIGDNKVVLHCYGSSLEMAKRFLKFDMKFGIGGVVTFKNGTKLKEVVVGLPLDRLLLETDSPYLSPEPFRGKTNEPYNIIYVAEKIAELKGLTLDEVLNETTKNAIKQFDLKL